MMMCIAVVLLTLIVCITTYYNERCTAFHSQPGLTKKSRFAPRELGLVRWLLNPEPVNAVREMCDAPFDSDLRNIINPG